MNPHHLETDLSKIKHFASIREGENLPDSIQSDGKVER